MDRIIRLRLASLTALGLAVGNFELMERRWIARLRHRLKLLELKARSYQASWDHACRDMSVCGFL